MLKNYEYLDSLINACNFFNVVTKFLHWRQLAALLQCIPPAPTCFICSSPAFPSINFHHRNSKMVDIFISSLFISFIQFVFIHYPSCSNIFDIFISSISIKFWSLCKNILLIIFEDKYTCALFILFHVIFIHSQMQLLWESVLLEIDLTPVLFGYLSDVTKIFV